jgi:hypothetical protein
MIGSPSRVQGRKSTPFFYVCRILDIWNDAASAAKDRLRASCVWSQVESGELESAGKAQAVSDGGYRDFAFHM